MTVSTLQSLPAVSLRCSLKLNVQCMVQCDRPSCRKSSALGDQWSDQFSLSSLEMFGCCVFSVHGKLKIQHVLLMLVI